MSETSQANQIVYMIDHDGITQYVKNRTVNRSNSIVETRIEFTTDKSEAKRFQRFEAAFIRNENQATDFHSMNA